jgi:hypothetical protein
MRFRSKSYEEFGFASLHRSGEVFDLLLRLQIEDPLNRALQPLLHDRNWKPLKRIAAVPAREGGGLGYTASTGHALVDHLGLRDHSYAVALDFHTKVGRLRDRPETDSRNLDRGEQMSFQTASWFARL